eukprot:Nk52_evm2s2640 gene=Nk52_evmTU2s2640
MNRFATSKYRNATGREWKKEEVAGSNGRYMQDEAFRARQMDGKIAASQNFLAFTWDSPCGNAFGVVNAPESLHSGGQNHNSSSNNSSLNNNEKFCLQSQHSSMITGIQFAPYEDQQNRALLATAGQDSRLILWSVASATDGNTSIEMMIDCEKQMDLHTIAPLGGLEWNPVVNGVVAGSSGNSSGGGNVISLFDTVKQAEMTNCKLGGLDKGLVQDFKWDSTGSLILTTCKDKMYRVLDPRAAGSGGAAVSLEGSSHAGLKDSRCAWLNDKNYFLTSGFSRMREREFTIHDSRTGKVLSRTSLDSSSGILMPFYDEYTGMLLLAGKGDTSIKFYDTLDKNPYAVASSACMCGDNTIDVAVAPHFALDVMECEVARLYRLTKNSIAPVSYTVQRRSHQEFHDDLYPFVFEAKSGIEADGWEKGGIPMRKKVSLNPALRNTSSKQTAKMSSKATTEPKHLSKLECESKSNAAPVQYATKPDSSLSQTSGKTNGLSSLTKQQTHPAAEPVSPIDTIATKRNAATQKRLFGNISHFKNMKGTVLHPRNNYEGVPGLCQTLPVESNLLVSTDKSIAFPIAGPGGKIAILESLKPFRITDYLPCIENSSAVLDYQISPFDSFEIAVACEDANIRVWSIGEEGLKETRATADRVFCGHMSKVNLVRYHPKVEKLLASASYDLTVKLWGLEQEKEEEICCLRGFGDHLTDMEFSNCGHMIATCSKDKMLRVFSVPDGKLIHEFQFTNGSKSSKMAWCGSHCLIISHFDRQSNRVVSLFDLQNFSSSSCSPNVQVQIDVNPSLLNPVYDEDCKILYLYCRGGTTMLMYEVNMDELKLTALPVFRAPDVYQGFSFFPKTSVDVMGVEIAKAYMLSGSTIEMVSFTVPRTRTAFFQDDIFPPTANKKDALMSVADFVSGIKCDDWDLMSLKPSGVTNLSEASQEHVAGPKKFVSYNSNYETEEEKKQKVMDSLVDSLGDKEKEPLPQDLVEGVDDDEWSD